MEKIHTPDSSSIFFANDKEEVLRISKDGFYYKGERVDDIHNIYERFNDWLKLAEKSIITK
jgi:hypothetical protein